MLKLFVYPLTPIENDCRDRTSNTVLAFTYLIFLQILVTYKCIFFYSSKYLLNERNNINQVKSLLYFYHVYLIYFYSITLKVMPDFCFLFFLLLFFNQTKHTDKHALKTNVFYKYLLVYSIVRGKLCNHS